MISLHVQKANGFRKIKGLIGNNKPEALLIKTRFGIHTFGLKFPIDVIVLNKQDEIVCLKKNLLPNRVFFWPIKYDTLLELPQGNIAQNKIKIKEKILLTFE